MKINGLRMWVQGKVSDVTPEDTKTIHLKDDVDFDDSAHHHTIGEGQFQVPSGAEFKKLQERVELLEGEVFGVDI